MLTTIDQFAGQDIWVYAELDEFSEDTYIRVQQVFDDEVIFNAAFSNDGDDIDEILYGELTSDIESIEIHPLDTLTTDALIAKIKAANGVTASRQFTKYPQGYVKASSDGIKYYEIEFANIDENSDVSDLEPDADENYSICIRGMRKPSIKEAEEFCREDMRKSGNNIVVNVAELTPEEAHAFYDMDREDSFPIFSTSTIKASSDYINAAKGGRTYTAFYNGEIFDVSSDCDALINQLKAEIDEAIAEGNVEDIDFGECWVELDSNEEVMYIADGDADYAEYL